MPRLDTESVNKGLGYGIHVMWYRKIYQLGRINPLALLGNSRGRETEGWVAVKSLRVAATVTNLEFCPIAEHRSNMKRSSALA